MFTCREVTEICASDKELSGWPKVKLKMHLFICKACSNYAKQIALLKEALKHRAEKIAAEEDEHIKRIEEITLKKIKKGGED